MRFIFRNARAQHDELDQRVLEVEHAARLFEANTGNLVPLYGEERQVAFYEPAVKIRRAPKYVLGDGILGRAFPDLNVVEILETLTGSDFVLVKEHELHHIRNPAASEYATRIATGTLYFTPNPYLSAI